VDETGFVGSWTPKEPTTDEKAAALRPGGTGVCERTVEEVHTTSHTGSPILSTPMMISMMESVAYHMVQPLLPPGSVTVGYEVHVKHKAPAPLGAVLGICSRLLEVDGRKLLFEVRVLQGEKIIGEGLIRRTIIQSAG
jgi:predicted thioesterase